MNSAALLARMNFALELAQNKVQGVKVDAGKFSAVARRRGAEMLFTDAAAADAARPSTKTISDQQGADAGAGRGAGARIAGFSEEIEHGIALCAIRSIRVMFSRRLFLKSSALAMFGAGTAPAWLSRALYAADAPSPRKKILVAIFQRGAVDGLNVVVPHGEKAYYDLRPNRDPAARRHAGFGHRSGRIFRTASVAAAAEADLRRGPIWRLCTRWDRPIRRGRISTRRITWNPARRA